MRIRRGGAGVSLFLSGAVALSACSSGSSSEPDASTGPISLDSGANAAPTDGATDAQADDSAAHTNVTDAATDTTTDDADASDASEDAKDPTSCPQGQALVYFQPGCGSDAHRVCAGAGDSCIIDVCNCDGTPGVRCDQSVKPYLHDGPCETPDATTDAHSDGD